MPSICQGIWDCQICPKAVSNAITHVIYQRGFHKPAQKCEENLILFLMKGEILVNSKEYAGTMLKGGEFILQAIGSMFEMLAMTECECIYYRFIQPELFCDFRFNHIMKEVSPPLIYTPFYRDVFTAIAHSWQCYSILAKRGMLLATPPLSCSLRLTRIIRRKGQFSLSPVPRKII